MPDERRKEMIRQQDKELISAVTGLRNTIQLLSEKVARDYPKKTEIRHARFVFTFAIIAGLIISSLFTIGVVSGCFLSKAAQDGHAAAPCKIMPGFAAAEARNRRTIERLEEIYQDIKLNREHNFKQDSRLSFLEEQVTN